MEKKFSKKDTKLLFGCSTPNPHYRTCAHAAAWRTAQVEKKFPKKDTKLLVGCSNGTQYSFDALEALDEVRHTSSRRFPEWSCKSSVSFESVPGSAAAPRKTDDIA